MRTQTGFIAERSENTESEEVLHIAKESAAESSLGRQVDYAHGQALLVPSSEQ